MLINLVTLGDMAKVLDITPLRSLIAVADTGGFHRAAASLQLSQSAVSQHVRRLERVLGRPLVEPDGRRARLTRRVWRCSPRHGRSSRRTMRHCGGWS